MEIQVVRPKDISATFHCGTKKSYIAGAPHILEDLRQHDDNNMAIFLTPAYKFDEIITPELIDFIQSNRKDHNTQIYFESMCEGHINTPVHVAHHIIRQLGISPSVCTLFTGGLQAKEEYEKYCMRHDIQTEDRIRVRMVNYWEFTARHSTQIVAPDFPIVPREKTFLSFNRMNRPHRTAMLGLLSSFLNQSYYSFFEAGYGSLSIGSFVHFLGGILSEDTRVKMISGLNSVVDKLPLTLNIEKQSQNINFVKADDLQYIQNSYFSLVSETFFFPTTFDNIHSEETSVFFSEKTFKPILTKHPFILVSRPNSLKYLRSMGYRTFHPLIDETYDTIENDEERLLAIIREVERLAKFTESDWLNWLRSMRPIVEHNYRTIHLKDKYEFHGL